ncbi:MAG TPA: gamma-glutamyltransferase [Gaiellaceae bacterium]|nr:gamma-glutamyltransferase [Gaiellaceae bacterium]
MRGAVAAGHPLTAGAGADVLRAGGNAVDACIAAAAVSWVCESPLTGLGGGGFLLVHEARRGRSRLLDFFVAVPGRPSLPEEHLELAVDFGGTAQRFRTGPAAVAVPGVGLGLWEAHRRFGSLPWAELLAPAARLARRGVVLDEPRAYLHRILDPLLRHSPEGDALYGPGRPLAAGERFAAPELAETLERLAAEGPRDLYRGETAERIAAHVPLSRADLTRYSVLEREPLAVAYRDGELRTNPPPAHGGRLLAVGLAALGDAPPTPRALARAMEAQAAARDAPAPAGTTHISVLDARGDAASLSCSLGSGSGVVVPGTGIHLNNMLGELHLAGDAGSSGVRAGERLPSLMAPSLPLREGRPRLVVGSAGSTRLHGAILQVVAGVAAAGLGVAEAVGAPRIHVEDGLAHCEAATAAVELEAAGYAVVRWRHRNLFFGGVSAVEVRADGSLAAAGDPRRGGGSVVVEA